MITFKKFLQEMPLASITKHNRVLKIDDTDTDETGKGSFEPADRKIIQKFMNDGTYKKKLEKIPFPLYVYIADDFDLERHGYEYPEGEITRWSQQIGAYQSRNAEIDLEKNILKIILIAVNQNLKKDPKSVHLIIGDNYSSEGQIALTPWMIAHRLAHAIFQDGEGFRQQVFKNIRLSYVDLVDIMELEDIADAYAKVFTFKSARSGKLISTELSTELATQYLVTGKITINYDVFTNEHAKLIKEKLADYEATLEAGCKALAGLVFYI